MTDKTAAEIVAGLRTNPDLYEAAARRENEIWSYMFSNTRIVEGRVADQAAAQSLRAGRDTMSLARLAQDRKLSFSRGLSLGCGSGRAERLLIKQGVCKEFVGIDVAEGAIAEARATAEREGSNITYRVADLNRVELELEAFDLVLAQTSLHHVLELEHVADQVRQCLKPGGYLWLSDFIGESQYQWSDERLRIANELLVALPEQYRLNHLNGRTISVVERKAPGTLISPFESIRSAEIVPVFSARFDIEYRNERGAVVDLVCPIGTRENFVNSEEGRALYEMLMRIDRILVTTGVLPPWAGDYLMRVPAA